MRFLKKLFAAFLLCATTGAAQSTVITGNFNGAGFDVIDFHVDATAIVDMAYLGNLSDAAMGLFDSAGNLVLFNDDANGSVKPRLTQTLAAGNYALMVTYCCNFRDAMPSYTIRNTDGFNSGSYYFLQGATLATTEAVLTTRPFNPGVSYVVELTNAVVGRAEVPEPGSVALFGVGAGVLGLARRRQRHAL